MWDVKLVTVFGGSGFIGRYVVQELAKRGHRVRVAVRNPMLAQFLKPLGAVGQIQPVQANLRFPESVAAAVAGADAVINLVGILQESGKQTFGDVQARGAAQVAQAAATAGARKLVQVSAIGADAGAEAVYARTKGEAEQAVLKAFPTATILRPSIVFGPEDGFFNRFAGIAKLSPVMPVICGDTRFQPVYVGDVADAVVKAVDEPGLEGKIYELGGPRTYSFRELLRYILAETHYSKPLFEIPLPLAKLQAKVMSLLPNPPLTPDQLIMLQQDNVVSEGAAGLPELGISPTPVEAIVPSYLMRYRPRGQFSTSKPAA
jgi:NADH dehydrogenase